MLVPRISDDSKFLVMDIFRSTEPVMMLLVAALPRSGTRLRRDAPLKWIEQSTPWDGTYKCQCPHHGREILDLIRTDANDTLLRCRSDDHIGWPVCVPHQPRLVATVKGLDVYARGT